MKNIKQNKKVLTLKKLSVVLTALEHLQWKWRSSRILSQLLVCAVAGTAWRSEPLWTPTILRNYGVCYINCVLSFWFSWVPRLPSCHLQFRPQGGLRRFTIFSKQNLCHQVICISSEVQIHSLYKYFHSSKLMSISTFLILAVPL